MLFFQDKVLEYVKWKKIYTATDYSYIVEKLQPLGWQQTSQDKNNGPAVKSLKADKGDHTTKWKLHNELSLDCMTNAQTKWSKKIQETTWQKKRNRPLHQQFLSHGVIKCWTWGLYQPISVRTKTFLQNVLPKDLHKIFHAACRVYSTGRNLPTW